MLDALRLVVPNRRVNDHLCEKDPGPLLKLMQKYVFAEKVLDSGPEKTNRMLVLRTLCNLFACESGRSRMAATRDKVIDVLPSILPAEKNTQVAVGTLVLNYCVEVGDAFFSKTSITHLSTCSQSVDVSTSEVNRVIKTILKISLKFHAP